MAPLKNIAWVGAGKVGVRILERIAKTGQFNIKLLVRGDPSTYTVPSGVASVVQVDHADRASLVSQLQGQDAVIVFCSFVPGIPFAQKHIALIDAAIEAGVKYFLPSEWALDTAGVVDSTSERYGATLPTNYILAPKRVSHNYLLCRAAEKSIQFAVVYPGVLVEACFANGLFQFDFAAKTAVLPDAGINPFPATTFDSLARAVITLFTNPALINDTFYHIIDGVLTQSEIFAAIEKKSGTKWQRASFSIKDAREAAFENMQVGTITKKEFFGTLMTPFFGGMQVFKKVDNNVLGLEVGGEGKLRDVVEKCIVERL